MNIFQSRIAAAALGAVLAAGMAVPAALAAEPGYKALEFTQYSGQAGFEFADRKSVV